MITRARRGRGRPRRLLAVLGVLCGLALSVAAAMPATAHAQLLETDPADGAVLAYPPSALRLTFDEPVLLQDGSVRVFDAAGAELATSARSVDAEVIVGLPADLSDGTYAVSFRVISIDTHPVSGGSTFSITAPSTSVVAAPTSGENSGLVVAAATANALAYIGLLATTGLVAFRVLILPAELRSAPAALRLRRPIVAGALVAVGSLLALLPITTARLTGDVSALASRDAWTSQLTAAPGVMLVWVTVGLAVALDEMRHRELSRTGRVTSLGGCALALGALALVGHTRTVGPAWLMLPSHLLHVGTAAVWFGGLIGLAYVLSTARRSRRAGPGAAAPPDAIQPDQAGAIVTRFSTVAAGLVAVLAVAGVLMGWRILGSWSALLGTGYGLTLLVKVELAAVVVGVAGYNRHRLLPALRTTGGWGRLRRTVAIEASALVAVLALTGWLVNQNPRDASPAEPEGVTFDEELGDDALRLHLSPATVGVNALELTLTDGDGDPLIPLDEPRIRLSLPDIGLGPIETPVEETGPGAHQATSDFPIDGDWIIEVSVRISQFEEHVVQIPVVIGASPPRAD